MSQCCVVRNICVQPCLSASAWFLACLRSPSSHASLLLRRPSLGSVVSLPTATNCAPPWGYGNRRDSPRYRAICPRLTSRLRSLSISFEQTYVTQVQNLTTLAERQNHNLSLTYGYPIGEWCVPSVVVRWRTLVSLAAEQRPPLLLRATFLTGRCSLQVHKAGDELPAGFPGQGNVQRAVDEVEYVLGYQDGRHVFSGRGIQPVAGTSPLIRTGSLDSFRECCISPRDRFGEGAF